MSQPTVTTPTTWKRVRIGTLAELRRIREAIGQVRSMRALGRVLDTEEAEGMLIMLWHDHNAARASLRWLRSVTIESYSHVSPSAAARMKGRHQ